MEIISTILFGIANSLLIPDIILLIALLVRALVLLGNFYGQFVARRSLSRRLRPLLHRLRHEDTLREIAEVLPKRDTTLALPYLREMLDRGSDKDYADYLLTGLEIRASKDLTIGRVLSKVGPVLGLIGTLIAMSPALVGLSSGDITAMAFNMQVVFATTVVGLVISMIGLVTNYYKQLWYQKDMQQLTFIAGRIAHETSIH